MIATDWVGTYSKPYAVYTIPSPLFGIIKYASLLNILKTAVEHTRYLYIRQRTFHPLNIIQKVVRTLQNS